MAVSWCQRWLHSEPPNLDVIGAASIFSGRECNVSPGESTQKFRLTTLRRPLSPALRQIGTQFLFTSMHRDHETNAIALLYRACPAISFEITPVRFRQRRRFRWIAPLISVEEQLHPAFRQKDLRHPHSVFVLKHPRSACPQVGELNRHIEMLELKFHEKIITEINCIGVNRLELGTSRGTGDG